MKKFRVIRQDWLNERGEPSDARFFVEYRVSFLWFSWWKIVRHREYGWDRNRNTPTAFTNAFDARLFVNRVLKESMPTQRWYTCVLEEFN